MLTPSRSHYLAGRLFYWNWCQSWLIEQRMMIGKFKTGIHSAFLCFALIVTVSYLVNWNFHQDAEIPNQSVVHAVRGGRWSARPGKGKTTPLSQVKLATVGEEQEDAGAAVAGAAAAGMKNCQTNNKFNLWIFICF